MEDRLESSILDELRGVPIMDAHTHLTGGRLAARGLHDCLLYHMVVSDLHAAGCPSGARLTEYPGWPTDEEARARIEEALPYFERIRNTSCWWGARIILHDLYGWDEPVTPSNWRRLDAMIRERRDDRSWQRDVIRRCGIHRLTTELARRRDGSDDDILHYSMEWAFFTRTQRNEFDTALYELERTWGKPPGSPIPHGAGGRPPAERPIRTLDDVRAAMAHFVDQLARSPVVSIATHISTDIDFRPVSDSEMAAALARRDRAGPAERDIYASSIHEAFLTALEPHADRIAFQFSFGAEPLPHETGSILPQRAIYQVGEIAARHPRIRFLCFVSSRHGNQSLCTLCREIPNLALAGYWWHNFFPGAMRQVMEERLDMLPVNKQVGFFSDAYAIEWTYAKSVLVRTQLAEVLARKVRMGQYGRQDAVSVARGILYDCARDYFPMKAAPALTARP
jgi:glucuronate isomerase